MFGLGSGEILIIVLIALVLFGKDDLPKTLRKVTKGINEFKKVTHEAQRSWNEVRDDVQRTIMLEEEKEHLREIAASATAPVALDAQAHAAHAHAAHGHDAYGHAVSGEAEAASGSTPSPNSAGDEVAGTFGVPESASHHTQAELHAEDPASVGDGRPHSQTLAPSVSAASVLPAVRVPKESVATQAPADGAEGEAAPETGSADPKPPEPPKPNQV